jgi:hypothetical protein
VTPGCEGDRNIHSTVDRSAMGVFELGQAWFIGIRMENCESATVFGLHAISFEHPARLKGGLAHTGIQAAQKGN